MILALCVFISTLILIMIHSKPLNEATAASLGALGMLVTGVVSPTQAFEVLKANANTLLFFLGLMSVSIVADRGGFFEWTTVRAITLANGNGRRLFLIEADLGSLSSMLWLVLLRQRGLDIHPLQYLKLGLIVTPPMLIVSALALYASSVFWS